MASLSNITLTSLAELSETAEMVDLPMRTATLTGTALYFQDLCARVSCF